jgi:tetratricopeptide (TPR) repeat protein
MDNGISPEPQTAPGAATPAPESAAFYPDLGQEAEEPDLSALSARELADRGLEQLKRGRVLAAETGGAGAADALFRQAEELLEESVNRDPAYLPALGNLGNTLLAHAQLKLGLAAAVEATPGAGAQELQASVAELQKEAVDMLVMAGRHYRGLLESDPSDGLAFAFWGRALALRGDIIALADRDGAAGLYTSAIEKFNQALALDMANAEAFLAWGHTLLKLSGLEDLAEAATYVEDARSCFENARSLRPGPEADAGLRACDEVSLSRGL